MEGLDYLNQTEHAVKGMFNSIAHYNDLIKLGVYPMTVISHSGKDGEFEAKYEEWRSRPDIEERFEFADYAKQEYNASKFSKQVVCGSILQIACKAIEVFSKNSHLSESHEFLFDGIKVEKRGKLARFAIGREVKRVPIGLIIYAGRNQYNHYELDLNQKLNVNVFNTLAVEHDYGDFKDPAFDLAEEGIQSYASNILSVLGWDSYTNYLRDMKSLLEVGA